MFSLRASTQLRRSILSLPQQNQASLSSSSLTLFSLLLSESTRTAVTRSASKTKKQAKTPTKQSATKAKTAKKTPEVAVVTPKQKKPAVSPVPAKKEQKQQKTTVVTTPPVVEPVAVEETEQVDDSLEKNEDQSLRGEEQKQQVDDDDDDDEPFFSPQSKNNVVEVANNNNSNNNSRFKILNSANNEDASQLALKNILRDSGTRSSNRINWNEVQEKLQHLNVFLTTAPNPNAQGDIASEARNFIKNLEMNYIFVDEPKVCIAEHDDPLTIAIAIELINAALRFSVPTTSAFICGLMAFLVDAVKVQIAMKNNNNNNNFSTSSFSSSSSSSTMAIVNSPLRMSHLSHIINSASTVSSLRLWDDTLFQRFAMELKHSLDTSPSALREVVAMINAIGNKPLGATRAFLSQIKQQDASNLIGAASHHVQDTGKSGESTEKTSSSSSSFHEITSSPSSRKPSTLVCVSNLVPVLFEKILQRLDGCVQEAVDQLSQSNGASNSQLVEQTFESVCAFADSGIASDPVMRIHLSKWIQTFIQHAPPRYLQALIVAATTLRLDNIFHPALRATYKMKDQLSNAMIAKTLSSLMLLPKNNFGEISVEMKNISNNNDNNPEQQKDGSNASILMKSTILLDPTCINFQQGSNISVQQVVDRCQIHFGKYSMNSSEASTILPEKVCLRVVSRRSSAKSQEGTLLKNDNTKSFLDQIFEITNKNDISETAADKIKSVDSVLSIFAEISIEVSPAPKDLEKEVDNETVFTFSTAANNDDKDDPFVPDKLVCYIVDTISAAPANNIKPDNLESSSSSATAEVVPAARVKRASNIGLLRKNVPKPNNAVVVVNPWSSVSTDIVSFLAGTVALNVTEHAATKWAADFHYKTLLGFSNDNKKSATNNNNHENKNNNNNNNNNTVQNTVVPFEKDPESLLSAQMEFLAVAQKFIPRVQVRSLLQTVMTTVKSKLTRYQEEMSLHSNSPTSAAAASAAMFSNNIENDSESTATATTQIKLSANQLRLLSCSTLAVKHDLPLDVAAFMLENLYRIINDCSMSDIASVLYTAGRSGVNVSDTVHAAIARRIGTILKFARASKRFAAATVASSSTSSSSTNNNNNNNNNSLSSVREQHEISPHDLAVAFSGLHLTRVRWDRMSNLFAELSEALSLRSKRYTPAQCCQLVAIARDVARTAQNRGNAALATEATKLARTFLPQIRHSIPSATDLDLLPLLAWLSTGHIRDVSLLDLIMERLISLKANPTICVAVLESIHSMGLLGGGSSDCVFRLIEVIQTQQRQIQQKQKDQNENNNNNNSGSTMSFSEQNAQIAFYATQLRSRDLELIKNLLAKATEAKSVKSLCSALGALSIIQSAKRSDEMRNFTTRLEQTLIEAQKWEEELRNRTAGNNNNNNNTLTDQNNTNTTNTNTHATNNSKHEDLQGVMDLSEDKTAAATIINDTFNFTNANVEDVALGVSLTTNARSNEDKMDILKREATEDIEKFEKSLENPELLKLVAGSKAVLPESNDTNVTDAASSSSPSSSSSSSSAVTLSAEQNFEAERKRRQYLYETRDIDIECLMAAMTAIAANDSTPSADRIRFLNKLCALLDRQISQLPAFRSQTLARQSFQQQQQLTTTNASSPSAPSSSTTTGEINSQDSGSVITASVAANSARALPLTPLTRMLAEVAAQNLPVFSIFRTCGKCYAAPGALLHMSPQDAVKALSSYAAFGFRDDYVIRALGLRCYSLKQSIAKNHRLSEQCAAAMKVFHINFDPRIPSKNDMPELKGSLKFPRHGGDGMRNMNNFK